MKVLLLHCYYQNRGGEDVAFEREAALLEATPGVSVLRFTRHNDTLRELGAVARARLPLTNAYALSACRELRTLVRRERPDVAHAHNLWPLLSPAALRTLRRAGVPTVFTAHNYYLFCLNGLFFRDGAVCTECYGRLPLPGIRHRCYRGFAGSVTRAAGLAVHRALRTFRQVGRVLTPTEFARSYFLRAGFGEQQVLAKPLSVEDPWAAGGRDLRPFPAAPHFVVASRLVPEKGVQVLLLALARCKSAACATVAGSGPAAESLRAQAERLGLGARVTFLGQVDHAQLRRVIAAATAVVIPSLWFETFGLTSIEAYALARPVVASDLGALTETVVHGETGLRVPPGDPAALAEALDTLAADAELCEWMGSRARNRYEERYTPQKDRERLLAIYRGVVAAAP